MVVPEATSPGRKTKTVLNEKATLSGGLFLYSSLAGEV